MSVWILRIVPVDPMHVPPPAAQRAAMERVRERAQPDIEIEARETEHVQFVDPGGLFEGVFCTSCGNELRGPWWGDAMTAAHQSQFADLAVVTPCCGARTALDALDYRPSAAFARFRIEAQDWYGTPDGRVSGGPLPPAALAVVAEALGCDVKQVLARY